MFLKLAMFINVILVSLDISNSSHYKNMVWKKVMLCNIHRKKNNPFLSKESILSITIATVIQMDKRTSAWYLNEASETAIVKFSIIRCMFIIQRLIRIRAQRHQHILALNKHQHKQNWKHRLQILFNVINILLHLFNVF